MPNTTLVMPWPEIKRIGPLCQTPACWYLEIQQSAEKNLVPDLGLQLSPWALKQYHGMTDKAMYLQEYEIDFGATLGQKVFHLDKEATLCKSFPIPPT